MPLFNRNIDMNINMSIDLGSAIVGAILSVGSGIILLYFTKRLEENKNKKIIARALLSEISINQTKVLPLANVNKLGSGNVVIEGISKIDIGKIKLLKKIEFYRSVFSTVSNNIGLLSVGVGAKILQYYASLKDIEDTSEHLVSSEVDTDIDKVIKESQARDWYNKAKETHDLGEELIKDLGRIADKYN